MPAGRPRDAGVSAAATPASSSSAPGLMFGATMVPKAIAALHEHYPGITFQLVSGVTEVNYPRLLCGRARHAVRRAAAARRDTRIPRVPPDHELGLRVIAGPKHPRSCASRVQARDLAQYPWVVMQHDRELVASLTATLRREGADVVRIAVEATSLSSLVRLLKSGPT